MAMFRIIKAAGEDQKPKAAMHLPKPVRNALISAAVLLVLMLAGGVAYTYYMGRANSGNITALATPVTLPADPTIKPMQPAANSPESASVEVLTSPVVRGSNASLTVKTNPGSACAISVVYNNVASTDSGLTPKTADSFGTVSWTWTVGASVPVGTWPVKVTCGWHGRTAVVQSDLIVQRN